MRLAIPLLDFSSEVAIATSRGSPLYDANENLKIDTTVLLSQGSIFSLLH